MFISRIGKTVFFDWGAGPRGCQTLRSMRFEGSFGASDVRGPPYRIETQGTNWERFPHAERVTGFLRALPLAGVIVSCDDFDHLLEKLFLPHRLRHSY